MEGRRGNKREEEEGKRGEEKQRDLSLAYRYESQFS